MPFKPDGKERICRWCDKPAKKYFSPAGVFKGYQSTCGSEECLKKQYSDRGVKARKQWRGRRICEKCGDRFTAKSRSQKWCEKCAPNRRYSVMLGRYNLSAPEYESYLSASNGMCPICTERKASVVDHDHKTGKVRGVICSYCNAMLFLIENDSILKNALIYLKKPYALEITSTTKMGTHEGRG